MSKNEQNNMDQEIDFASITKGIGNSFQRLNTFFYKCIQFVIRNIVIFAILFVSGAALGTYLDSSPKVFKSQIIVSPNFGSVDYLYSKVSLIESKIKERDTMFLKSIGIQNPKSLLGISINPIVDVYKFVDNNEQNYKMIELMAQDGDIKKIIAETTTSKNYVNHMIRYTTKGITSRQMTAEPIMKYLNKNEFYEKVQAQYLKNVDAKLKQNDNIIAQIDSVLGNFSTASKSGTSDKLVYYNENTQLNDVLKTKDELIKEQGQLRLDLVSLDRIVKDNSSVTNIKNEESLTGKMKVLLPLVLIGFFLCIYFFRAFYRKQTLKHTNI